MKKINAFGNVTYLIEFLIFNTREPKLIKHDKELLYGFLFIYFSFFNTSGINIHTLLLGKEKRTFMAVLY